MREREREREREKERERERKREQERCTPKNSESALKSVVDAIH